MVLCCVTPAVPPGSLHISLSHPHFMDSKHLHFLYRNLHCVEVLTCPKSSLSFCCIMDFSFFFDVCISSYFNQSKCAQLQFPAHSHLFNLQFLLPVWRQNMAEGQILGITAIWKFNSTRASKDGLRAWLKLYTWSGEYNFLACLVEIKMFVKMLSQGKLWDSEQVETMCVQKQEAGYLTSTMTLKGQGCSLKGPDCRMLQAQLGFKNRIKVS